MSHKVKQLIWREVGHGSDTVRRCRGVWDGREDEIWLLAHEGEQLHKRLPQLLTRLILELHMHEKFGQLD